MSDQNQPETPRPEIGKPGILARRIYNEVAFTVTEEEFVRQASIILAAASGTESAPGDEIPKKGCAFHPEYSSKCVHCYAINKLTPPAHPEPQGAEAPTEFPPALQAFFAEHNAFTLRSRDYQGCKECGTLYLADQKLPCPACASSAPSPGKPRPQPGVQELLKQFTTDFATLNAVPEKLANPKYSAYLEGASDFSDLIERQLSAAAPRPQEPSAELIEAIESLLEWVPKSGKGSSGYLRVERVKAALQFFSPAQSPRTDFGTLDIAIRDLGELAEMLREKHESTGFDGSIALRLDQVAQTLKSCEPAQSQGAAFVQPPTAGNPSCHVCGAEMVRDGSATNNGFECLSCGATTSCTEGDKK